MRSGVFRLIFVRDIHYRFTIEVGNVCLLFEFLCEVWPKGDLEDGTGTVRDPVQYRTVLIISASTARCKTIKSHRHNRKYRTIPLIRKDYIVLL